MAYGFVLLLLLLLLAALAEANTPACPGLAIQAKTSRRKVESGDRVLVTVKVKNTGPATLDDLNVGVSALLVADWKTPIKTDPNRVDDGTSVNWLDQYVLPGRQQSYQVKGAICGDAAGGMQSIAQAAVYRLNSTGGVKCMTTADVTTVRPLSTSPLLDGGRTLANFLSLHHTNE